MLRTRRPPTSARRRRRCRDPRRYSPSIEISCRALRGPHGESLVSPALVRRDHHVEQQQLKRVGILQLGETGGRHQNPCLFLSAARVQPVESGIGQQCSSSIARLAHVDSCVSRVDDRLCAGQVDNRRKLAWNRCRLSPCRRGSGARRPCRRALVAVNGWSVGSLSRGRLRRGLIRAAGFPGGFGEHSRREIVRCRSIRSPMLIFVSRITIGRQRVLHCHLPPAWSPGANRYQIFRRRGSPFPPRRVTLAASWRRTFVVAITLQAKPRLSARLLSARRLGSCATDSSGARPVSAPTVERVVA